MLPLNKTLEFSLGYLFEKDVFLTDCNKTNHLHVLLHGPNVDIGDVNVPIFRQFIVVVLIDELS